MDTSCKIKGSQLHSWSNFFTMEILRSGRLVRYVRTVFSPKSNVTIAVEQLVHFSETDPAIFKTNQLTPVKDLKLLIKDYPVEYFRPSVRG